MLYKTSKVAAAVTKGELKTAAYENLKVLKARDIEPLHDVTNSQLLDSLKKSMKRDGWVGDPVVVLAGKRPKGVSGSHRVAAAADLGMKIPALVIGPRAGVKMWEAEDDDAVIARLKDLKLPQAVRLMERQKPDESPVTKGELKHYKEGDLGPGVPKREGSLPPKIEHPQLWEFSAHPHRAERAGMHIDLRLGNPETGIAHSFVIPRRGELPAPGKSSLAVPTFDHTVEYMDYTGPISTEYGRGVVQKGRRTQTELYHSEPGRREGTILRFNLYDSDHPEEFVIRRSGDKFFLTNKTQTRERRPDLPAHKPKYKEINIDKVEPTDDRQAMMPKLDGAHAIIDLKAGRSPRVYSHVPAKKATTGLVEHTHKLRGLLEQKVPKELDGTILRAEILGVDSKGEAVPLQVLSGMLNSKVLKSREKQDAAGVRLRAYPFSVVKHRGKKMEDAPFSEKLKVLEQVQKSIPELEHPELATSTIDKIVLLNNIKKQKHPLTQEGVVLVDRDEPAKPIKAKVTSDFDVFVRKIVADRSKTGRKLDRGRIAWSWTPDGPIMGTVGGFKYQEGRDMLKNPDKYVGRVAKVKAQEVFYGMEGMKGKMFQPRFKEWHLDKGDIEKQAVDPITMALIGLGSHLGTNIGVKALHGTKAMRALRQGGLARGLRGALEGKPQSLGSRMAETWAGPELVATEHAGRTLGKGLRDLPEGQRYRVLKKLRKAVAMSPEFAGRRASRAPSDLVGLSRPESVVPAAGRETMGMRLMVPQESAARGAPIFEDVVGGVNKALAAPLPGPGAVEEASRLSKLLRYAPAVPAAAIEPAALVHMGVNEARRHLASTALGKRVMRESALRGVASTPVGEQVLARMGMSAQVPRQLTKPEALLQDVLISPMIRNPERMAAVTTRMAQTPTGRRSIARVAGAMEPLTRRTRAEVARRVREAKPVKGVSPESPALSPRPSTSKVVEAPMPAGQALKARMPRMPRPSVSPA